MLSRRDFYIATHSSVRGWGGGRSAAAGVAEALQRAGYTTRLLGIHDAASDVPAARDADQIDLSSGLPAWQWRLRTWRLPSALARAVRALPPPLRGLIAISPTWVGAARAVWPAVPVAYVFPCLLANCLPFTWSGPPGFAEWLSYRGLCRTEQRAFAAADLVLAPSPAAAAEIRAFAPGTGGRLKTCTYGVQRLRAAVDARVRLRSQLEILPDVLLCAVIGTCDRNKNFALAIRALRETPRAQLVVIGDGAELPALERLATALDVRGRVAFVGSQSRMGDWYAAVDTLISTSRYDTFPNVVLEAMAAGKPVLVPRHDPPRTCAGIAEFVEQAGAGLLYAGADAPALAQALRRLSVETGLARRLGMAGAEAVQRACAWEHVTRRILAVCGCASRAAGCRAPRAVTPACAP